MLIPEDDFESQIIKSVDSLNTVMEKCDYCDRSYQSQKVLRRHVRSEHGYYCNKFSCIYTRKIHDISEFPSLPRIITCKLCGAKVPKKFRGSEIYCSVSCNTKVRNYARKIPEKISRRSKEPERYYVEEGKILFKCHQCDKGFYRASSSRKFCSKECIRNSHLVPPEKRKPLGGYRKRAGRGRHGYYNHIWCDSTWEMAFVWYCHTNNLNIVRNEQSFKYIDAKGRERRYYPDFILNGNYIEIKGWMRENDKEKLEQFPHPIKILRGKEMKPIIQAAKNFFSVDDLSILFSEHKVKEYHRNCKECNTPFTSTRKEKSFCNKSCMGFYNNRPRKIDKSNRKCVRCFESVDENKRKETQFCSRSCSSLTKWETRQRSKTKYCVQCNSPFDEGSRAKYFCSHTCTGAFKKGKLKTAFAVEYTIESTLEK